MGGVGRGPGQEREVGWTRPCPVHASDMTSWEGHVPEGQGWGEGRGTEDSRGGARDARRGRETDTAQTRRS